MPTLEDVKPGLAAMKHGENSETNGVLLGEMQGFNGMALQCREFNVSCQLKRLSKLVPAWADGPNFSLV
jgi:hypothetical protein